MNQRKRVLVTQYLILRCWKKQLAQIKVASELPKTIWTKQNLTRSRLRRVRPRERCWSVNWYECKFILAHLPGEREIGCVDSKRRGQRAAGGGQRASADERAFTCARPLTKLALEVLAQRTRTQVSSASPVCARRATKNKSAHNVCSP